MTSSLWQDAATPFASDPLPAQADVVVVGAGLTGLSCAYHLLLRQPGSRVLVLDAAAPGVGASGRTTGMVTPGIGQNFAGLLQRFGVAQAAAMYQETLQAVQAVGDLIAVEQIACDYAAVGQLVVAHGRSGAQRLARQAAALAATGQPYRRLTPTELAARIHLAVPQRDELAALLLPHAATVHPYKLVTGLAAAVRRRGGSLVGGATVTGLTEGAAVGVHLASGQTVSAGTVVLATAGSAPALAGLTGRILPITLSVLATAPLTSAQQAALGWAGRECVIDSRQLFSYFRLTADQRIVIGGGAPYYGTQTLADAAFADLRRELQTWFPGGAQFPVDRCWSGTIDYVLDGLPVIGPRRAGSRVWHAGGFCGHGVALGVRCGHWIAAQLHGDDLPPWPWLRPSAPWVPGDWLRRACFGAASRWMRFADQRC